MQLVGVFDVNSTEGLLCKAPEGIVVVKIAYMFNICCSMRGMGKYNAVLQDVWKVLIHIILFGGNCLDFFLNLPQL